MYCIWDLGKWLHLHASLMSREVFQCQLLCTHNVNFTYLICSFWTEDLLYNSMALGCPWLLTCSHSLLCTESVDVWEEGTCDLVPGQRGALGWHVGQGTGLQFVQLVLAPGARTAFLTPPRGLCPLSFYCSSLSFGSSFVLERCLGVHGSPFHSISHSHTKRASVGRINRGVSLVTVQGTGRALPYLGDIDTMNKWRSGTSCEFSCFTFQVKASRRFILCWGKGVTCVPFVYKGFHYKHGSDAPFTVIYDILIWEGEFNHLLTLNLLRD